MSLVELSLQSFASIVVLVDPITRGVFFRTLTADEPERRPEFVRTLMVTVAVLLGGAAVIGKPLLDVLGINLGAVGVAGGIILGLMGLEMLLGGEASRAQGGAEAHEEPQPISAEDSIVVPYATPFMAGPGAIATVITLANSTGDSWDGTWATLIALAVVVLLIPVGHLWLVNRMNFSERTVALITRFGGLIVTTIGVQLVLNGIRAFYNT